MTEAYLSFLHISTEILQDLHRQRGEGTREWRGPPIRLINSGDDHILHVIKHPLETNMCTAVRDCSGLFSK